MTSMASMTSMAPWRRKSAPPSILKYEMEHFNNLGSPDVKAGLSFEIDQQSYISSEAPKNGSCRPLRKSCFGKLMSSIWNRTLGKIGGDWVYLALLGITMAWISLLMEYTISICISARIYLCRFLLHDHPFLQYLGWIWLPVCLILFSTGFTKLVAPQAAGSGIPEMMTILRGLVIKKSFTFKALIAKIIGLTATLATGLPVGKEGPFVHISSMTAVLLAKATTSFKGIYENKSRHSEMLSAACAVGVATAFAAPVGGVLFSIEVTAVHFAVRNYWRGFFAAVFATVVHRLLAVWFKKEETLMAIFRTEFSVEFPYSPQELVAFALIGVVCGFLGAFFVWAHRLYSTFKNTNRVMQSIVNKSFLLYPFLVTLLYTSLTFPFGLGMLVAGDTTTDRQLIGLFSNYSWQKDNPTIHEFSIIEDWTSRNTGIFVNLSAYIVFTFFGTIIASTIPVPAGIFIPVFKIGAALGRLFGEGMVLLFPYGINLGVLTSVEVIPGGYAIVGAAALAGAVTHTVSSSVIAFELTGEIVYCIPVMIAVLIANAIAQALQPSIFDSIIKMKKLPFLPSIATTSSTAYNIFVEDFMVRDVEYIWYGMTFKDLERILVENRKLRILPLVDSKDSMILLGSIQQSDLITLVETHLSQQKKVPFFKAWKLSAERSLLNDILEMKMKEEDETNVEGQMKDAFVHENGRAPIVPFESVENEENKESDTEEGPSLGNGQRRLSRFSVTKVNLALMAPLLAKTKPTSNDKEPSLPSQITVTDSPIPAKGILKKTNSFNFEPHKLTLSKRSGLSHKSYATIHAGDSQSAVLKHTLASVMKAKSLLGMDSRSSRITFTGVSTSYLPTNHLLERIREQELLWEEKEKLMKVDFTKVHINPAPHQLVERTSLLQVHSMFSLLTLNHSYVTAIGRLIGVVSLKELREAVEKANSGEFNFSRRNSLLIK